MTYVGRLHYIYVSFEDGKIILYHENDNKYCHYKGEGSLWRNGRNKP